MKQLIPGLPNEIAQECLIHVPYNYLSIATLVSKGWKAELELPKFLKHRKASGYSQTIVVMAKAQVDPNQNSSAIDCHATPVYKLTIYEPETGYWHHLPPLPGFPNGVPMFCQLIGIGSNLVVLGGWHPKTLATCNAVFIYNFLSATWRRVADMPGVRRSFFGCASDSDRMVVYVAGGHDEEKEALRSVMAYDMATDKWLVLPDMARDRDECKAMFHGGKLHVFGGYDTDGQGQFEKSFESFDFAAWQWDPVQEDYLATAMCPNTCMADADGNLYITCDLEVEESAIWQAVAELPVELCNVAYMTSWKNKLLLIGSAKFGEPHMAYLLDLKSCKWTMMEVPIEFTGHVQFSCCFEI